MTKSMYSHRGSISRALHGLLLTLPLGGIYYMLKGGFITPYYYHGMPLTAVLNPHKRLLMKLISNYFSIVLIIGIVAGLVH